MRVLFALILISLTTACSLTPTQKKWAGFAAGVLIVGAIAAHDDSEDPMAQATSIVGEPSKPCRPQPDGSCR